MWSDGELIRFAEAIVVGTVVDVHGEWDRGIDVAYSLVTLDVTARVKGELATGRVTLKQLGGEAAGVRLAVPGQATFQVGERVLVFLERRPRDRTFYTVGLWQGKWRVTADATSGEPLAVRDRPDPGQRGPFGRARDVRPLNGLLGQIAAGGNAADRDAVMPLVARSMRSANATPDRAQLPVARRPATDSEVRLRLDPAPGDSSSRWNAAVTTAARQWNGAQRRLQVVDDGSSTARCALSFDPSRTTVIGVASACEELATGGSVLALSGSYVAADRGVGDKDGVTLHRFLVANDPAFQALAPQCVDRMAAHEIAHALGLRDGGEHGDTLSPVLAASCGTSSDVFTSLTPRGMSARDLGQLLKLGPASVAAAISAPSAPRNLSASANGSTVILTWDPPVSGDAPTSYVVEAGSTEGASDLANVSTGNSSTSLLANGVAAGTYFVRVRGVNEGGLGPASNEVMLTVGGGAPSAVPGAPGILTASVVGSTVTLSWTAPLSGGAPTTYAIEAGTSPGAANLASFSTGNTATTFMATGVEAGSYYVRVRAANAAGAGAASNEVIVTVGGRPPTDLSGAISRSDTTCNDGFSGSKPCRVASFTVSAAGILTATLTWSESVDLDLSLWRGGTAIALSNGVTQTESVSETVEPGNYELRVTYYGGTATANFLLRVGSPGGTTPALAAPGTPTPTPTPTPTDTLLLGVIGRTDTTCNDGEFVLPCRIATFTVSTAGTLRATLTWDDDPDLDLSLWRGNTLIKGSYGVTETETITETVSPGNYELRVTYYEGSISTLFALRIISPGGTTPALVAPGTTAPPVTTTNLSGTINGTEPTCSDGVFVRPCRIATFTISTAGTLTATLTWSESPDLDLTLWRGSTIVEWSDGVTQTETISAAVTPGSYELRVSYYAGTGPANFLLRIGSPGGTTPALTPVTPTAPTPTPSIQDVARVLGPTLVSVTLTALHDGTTRATDALDARSSVSKARLLAPSKRFHAQAARWTASCPGGGSARVDLPDTLPFIGQVSLTNTTTVWTSCAMTVGGSTVVVNGQTSLTGGWSSSAASSSIQMQGSPSVSPIGAQSMNIQMNGATGAFNGQIGNIPVGGIVSGPFIPVQPAPTPAPTPTPTPTPAPVTQFDGVYRGTYTGAFGTFGPQNGSVAFSVSNGRITVTAPGSGTGTVTAAGAATFGGSLGVQGINCTFTGTFRLNGTTASASGPWNCSGLGQTGTGTWNATR